MKLIKIGRVAFLRKKAVLPFIKDVTIVQRPISPIKNMCILTFLVLFEEMIGMSRVILLETSSYLV